MIAAEDHPFRKDFLKETFKMFSFPYPLEVGGWLVTYANNTTEASVKDVIVSGSSRQMCQVMEMRFALKNGKVGEISVCQKHSVYVWLQVSVIRMFA